MQGDKFNYTPRHPNSNCGMWGYVAVKQQC